jgi:signal transduction histidine kinase
VQTRNLSTEVHKLAYRLHPAKLKQLGLVSAVASLCRELSQQSGIPINFAHEDIPRSLPDDVALCAFRVIQESLSNAIRHSGSKKIAVKLTAQTGRLWLQVSDSGKGFLVTPSRCNRRLGLLSMRERARLIDGQLHVRSEPGQGTEVELTVMLPHKEDLS